MRTRNLFLLGVLFLILAFAGVVLTIIRSPYKKTLTIERNLLLPPLATPEQIDETPTPESTNTPTLIEPPKNHINYRTRVDFIWQWLGGLGPDDYFQIEIWNRYGDGDDFASNFTPIHVVWVKDEFYGFDNVEDYYSREYKWRVTVVRGVPKNHAPWSTEVWYPPDEFTVISTPSEMRTFYVEPGNGPPPGVTVTFVPGANTPTPTSTPIPTVVIEAEWPEEIEVGQSDWIRITLFRTLNKVLVATVETTKHSAAVATSRPIGGTPATLFENTFGPQYEACAITNLEGKAFEIGELTTGCQSLEQPYITWEWNIRPIGDEVTGKQIVNARIETMWKSGENTKESIQRELWRSRFEITVKQSLMKRVNIFSLLSALIGSMLSTP